MLLCMIAWLASLKILVRVRLNQVINIVFHLRLLIVVVAPAIV